MVRIGAVWDDTVRVLSGRGAIVARIALVTLFLPPVAEAAIAALAPGAPHLFALLRIALFVVTLTGTLALTALASDPAVDERAAYRAGTRALGGTILALLVIGLGFVLLSVPLAALLAAAGFDFTAAAADQAQQALAPGPAIGAVLYALVYLAVVIWAVARLSLLYAVAVNERAGVGAIRRSFRLTRGLTWRIIGVLILYGIVLTVIWSAVQSVAGLVFRLLLGPDLPGAVAVLTAVPVSAALTALGVLQPVFAARLYAAVRGEQDAPVHAA